MSRDSEAKPPEVARWIGLIGSPLLAIGIYLGLSGAVEAGDLPESGRRVIGLAALMAGLWLTEAIPLAATALLPLALLPLLNVSPLRTAAVAYAEETIFLFLGGFLLGRGFEKSGLHRRVALLTLMGVGVRPRAVIAGIMIATALISFWVSNTATAIMMLPIGMSLITLIQDSIAKNNDESSGWDAKQVSKFSMALLLGLAYAASIGGMGTLIGTPPNMQFATSAREATGETFPFARWMLIGVPMVVLMLPMAWALLVLVLYPVKATRIPGGRDFVRTELRKLGSLRSPEIVTLIVFLCAVTLWVGREPILRAIGWEYVDANGKNWLPLTDAGIGIIAALLLFLIPSDRKTKMPVLEAKDIDAVPWSILLLFGGGLSLAAAMKATGVDTYLGSLFAGMHGLPTLIVILVIVASMTFLSELASNTAVAATTLPILAAAAEGLGVHPYVLMIPATLAASCGYMLPVATPPNAIVFATGRVSVREMAKAGILMDVISVVTITLFFWLVGARLLGLDVNAS